MDKMDNGESENPQYLTDQLITYIGNKRALLGFIAEGLDRVRARLGKEQVSTFDVFSGSGIVSRFLKKYSSHLIVNDLENYASIINHCYLANRETLNLSQLGEIYTDLVAKLDTETLEQGLIAERYAPKDDEHILHGERAFYTNRNARYLDTARVLVAEIPEALQCYFLAPLLAEASVHANTSGVFKGFYKNSATGIGQFGGRKGDALIRIRGDISMPFPVFSNFSCETSIFSGDANVICEEAPEVDVAYLDPPYNQHPYGSNYFMLNLLADYKTPETVSVISGIPSDWNRSAFNRKKDATTALTDLAKKIRAKYLIISFNSEGFISLKDMTELLSQIGKTEILETKYNAFRGSRNLSGRGIHVKEYLYLVEKY